MPVTETMEHVPMRRYLESEISICALHADAAISLAKWQGISFISYMRDGCDRSGILKRVIPDTGPYRYTFQKLQRDKPIRPKTPRVLK